MIATFLPAAAMSAWTAATKAFALALPSSAPPLPPAIISRIAPTSALRTGRR